MADKFVDEEKVLPEQHFTSDARVAYARGAELSSRVAPMEKLMRDEINAALKQAMLDQDKRRMATLRLINAAIKDRDIAARSGGKDPVSEREILEILTRMIRQRQEFGQSLRGGEPPRPCRGGARGNRDYPALPAAAIRRSRTPLGLCRGGQADRRPRPPRYRQVHAGPQGPLPGPPRLRQGELAGQGHADLRFRGGASRGLRRYACDVTRVASPFRSTLSSAQISGDGDMPAASRRRPTM